MENSSRKEQYKHLLDLGTKLRTSSGIDNEIKTISQLSKIIEQSDLLNGQSDAQNYANNPTEVVMDAHVLHMSHELLGHVIHKRESSEFSDEEYINALNKIIYKNDSPNWDAISEIISGISKTAKFSCCLLGSFDPTPLVPKPTKERQKRMKSTPSEKLRPESISKLEKHDKGAQKLNVIFHQLAESFEKNNKEPVPYYKVIIDPHSFMNTIDNAFQIAFLVSNRSASIELGDNGLPVVRPTPRMRGAEPDKNSPDKNSIQSVFTLNFNTYKEMINYYNIREPLLSFDSK